MQPSRAGTLGTLRAQATWLVPAAVTLAVALVRVGHPVLWQDELATWSATTRSLPDLVRLGTHEDGVLLAYYALVHLWVSVVGASPVTLRVPSALAMAASAAVVALIGARLSGRRAGLLAGLVLAALPSVSAYGQEARAYALAVLLAAVSTLLLLRWVERPSTARTVAYAAAIVALGAVQLTAVLVVLAHAVVVLSLRRDGGPPTRRWLLAVGAAAVALLPVAYVGHRQSGQVGWIAPTSWAAVAGLPARLFGSGWVAWVVVALALVAVVRRDRGTVLYAALAVLPVPALAAVSLAAPLFLPRYLLPTLVGWALLAGVGLARVPWPAAVVALAALVAVGLTSQVAVRGTTKHGQPDYRTVAAVLVARGRPGDAVVVPTAGGARFRVGVRAYLPASAWPRDPLVVRDARAAQRLDARECRPATCLGSPARLWVGCRGRCADPLSSLQPATSRLLRARGYRLAHEWRVEGGAVSLFTAARGR